MVNIGLKEETQKRNTKYRRNKIRVQQPIPELYETHTLHDKANSQDPQVPLDSCYKMALVAWTQDLKLAAFRTDQVVSCIPEHHEESRCTTIKIKNFYKNLCYKYDIFENYIKIMKTHMWLTMRHGWLVCIRRAF